jgi:hypothetical protein
MTQLNAVTFSSFILTVIALFLLSLFPLIPPWAMFISWACFFHLNGGVERNLAYFSTIRHLGLGISAAWLSAIILLNNPFSTALTADWWPPVSIGLMIALLSRMAVMRSFVVTPAIIYGYAATFAFLSTAGAFSMQTLLSLSMHNALIVMIISIVVGASAGYINAVLVHMLLAKSSSKD